jgi:ribosomal protein L31E
MAEEKVLTINLRKEIVKSPGWERSRRASKLLREILEKNIDTESLKIDKKLNEKIWSKQGENPGRIRVKIVKVDDKTSRAELMEK